MGMVFPCPYLFKRGCILQVYDFEIDRQLRQYNYDIPSNIYFNICDSSSQITAVHYSAYESMYSITTDNSFWQFKVHKT